LLILAVALAAPPAGEAAAHGYKTRTIEIVHPWIAETARDGAGDVSMIIRNHGRHDERLISIETEVAAKAALLVTAGPDAKAAVPASMTIPAGGEVALGKSGSQLHLDGLKRGLGAYDRFPLVLVFERAGRMSIEVMVEEAEPAAGAEPPKY
jgi:hypothetical protein